MARRKSRQLPKKPRPARRQRTASGKRTATSKRPRPARQANARRADPPATSFISRLSLDRKLDILGVGSALAGLLTLFSLLSPQRSSLTGAWIAFLHQLLGWGGFVLPLALIAVGLWLVLRHFERIPQVMVERIFGLGLLYLNLLAALGLTLGQAVRAGGLVGDALASALLSTLGGWGAAIALSAWLLIALALSLDTSIPELFRWAPLLLARLGDRWDEGRTLVGWPKSPARAPLPGPAAPPQPETGRGPDGAFTPNVSPGPAGSAPPAREWALPPVGEILDTGGEIRYDDEYDLQRARVIEETLASFGARARVVEINRGPTITQFGVEPDFIETNRGRTRVRVGKIASLANDLALALAASRIRVEAPVPGRGFVGIEVPNEEASMVALRDVIESEAFQRLKSPLRFALGQDVAGNAVAADLAAMPHLLIAGATGSGKSVSVNAIICCLLLHNTPDDLRLIMVDPKRVELTNYNGIPHLLAPVVVDLERVVGALQWVSREMDDRYRKLAKAGARHIDDYNARLAARGEPRLPYLVVIVDELADLMMIAPEETERSLTRLAQLARATGIHLVISTQRPSVDVVTGLIKANFPARIAFAVASGVDSRVIIDQPGAERLLGRGDMLFQAPDAAAPVRLQGVFVSDDEILRLVQYWRQFIGAEELAPAGARGPVDALPPGIPLKQLKIWEEMEPDQEQDPLLEEAVDLIRRQGRASISLLQRRLRIGYTRAARLVELMEERGIVGPPQPGTQAREVLDYGPAASPAGDG